MTKQEKKPDRFFDRVVDQFDLPGEVLGDLPRVTLLGGRRVLVENHKGLLDYGTEEIRIAGKRLTVLVAGDGLKLCAMNPRALLITGDVFRVELVY